jgi:hypothetical protein
MNAKLDFSKRHWKQVHGNSDRNWLMPLIWEQFISMLRLHNFEQVYGIALHDMHFTSSILISEFFSRVQYRVPRAIQFTWTWLETSMNFIDFWMYGRLAWIIWLYSSISLEYWTNANSFHLFTFTFTKSQSQSQRTLVFGGRFPITLQSALSLESIRLAFFKFFCRSSSSSFSHSLVLVQVSPSLSVLVLVLLRPVPRFRVLPSF